MSMEGRDARELRLRVLRGSEDALRAEDRRRTRIELAAAWRARADRLDGYAAALRADGQTDAGPEGPIDAEAAAQEWREAADAIEAETDDLEPAGLAYLSPATRPEPHYFEEALERAGSPPWGSRIGPAVAPAGPVDEREAGLRRGLRSILSRVLRGPGVWRVW